MAYSSNQRQRAYQPPCSDEERLLVRRMRELATAASFGAVRCTDFLSEREQQLTEQAARTAAAAQLWFGGYEQAERKMAAFAADEGLLSQQMLEIEAVHIVLQEQARSAPTHRDYLGALLGLGLARRCLGDILVYEQGAFVYAKTAAAVLIQQELCSVGRCAVRCEPAVQPVSAFWVQQGRVQHTATVASLRLDAVLAVMLRAGRSHAAACIRRGLVSINGVPTACVHEPMYEQDVVRVKGHGKYQLLTAGGQSKKGRTVITYCQF